MGFLSGLSSQLVHGGCVELKGYSKKLKRERRFVIRVGHSHTQITLVSMLSSKELCDICNPTVVIIALPRIQNSEQQNHNRMMEKRL